MTNNRVELKTRSVELIRTAKPKVIPIALAYTLLSVLVGFLSSRLVGIQMSQDDLMRYSQYVIDGNYEYALAYIQEFSPSFSSVAIDSLLTVVMSIVSAGFVLFLLNTIRNAGACLGNLLDGFGFFWRIIALNVLEGLFIFLWSLLLFVPGIIAFYSYRMAIYLLIDNPQMSVMQCLRQSKKMMKGHKWELFVLDLSFLGWEIASSLPIVGYVVQIWSVPYIGLTKALYYERLSGRDIYAAGRPGAVPPPWDFDK